MYLVAYRRKDSEDQYNDKWDIEQVTAPSSKIAAIEVLTPEQIVNCEFKVYAALDVRTSDDFLHDGELDPVVENYYNGKWNYERRQLRYD